MSRRSRPVLRSLGEAGRRRRKLQLPPSCCALPPSREALRRDKMADKDEVAPRSSYAGGFGGQEREPHDSEPGLRPGVTTPSAVAPAELWRDAAGVLFGGRKMMARRMNGKRSIPAIRRRPKDYGGTGGIDTTEAASRLTRRIAATRARERRALSMRRAELVRRGSCGRGREAEGAQVSRGRDSDTAWGVGGPAALSLRSRHANAGSGGSGE